MPEASHFVVPKGEECDELSVHSSPGWLGNMTANQWDCLPEDRVGRHILHALANSATGGPLTVAELAAHVSPEYPYGGVTFHMIVARVWLVRPEYRLPGVIGQRYQYGPATVHKI